MQMFVDKLYGEAAKSPVPNLCCPASYDSRYLTIIPKEVLERDYGCGDPTPYVRAGETVLDLGSGSGKMCFVLGQIVGSEGRVIGLDANAAMLAIARRYAPTVALRIGWRNVEFRRATLNDIDLDLDQVEKRLAMQPIKTVDDMRQFEQFGEALRATSPPVSDATIDVVVSNCVINLVLPSARPALFNALLRKLKPGGRIALSDIVCDGAVSQELADDEKLWAACISGAYRIEEFIRILEKAGFIGVRVANLGPLWRSQDGIAFRSATIVASRPAEVLEAPSSVYAIYRGPWKRVEDERGRVYERGERVCLCTEEGRNLLAEPYSSDVAIWIGAKAEPGAGDWVAKLDTLERAGQRHNSFAEASPASCGPNCC